MNKRNKGCETVMQQSPFRTQLRLAILVVALFSVFAAGWQYWQHSQGSRDRNQLYVDLLERSGQLNRDLPKLLDRQTRFERAEVVNYGMRFVYALVAVDRFQNDSDALRQQVEPFLLTSFCTAKSMRFYRQEAEFVEYLYLDRNNMHLFTLRFSATDCDATN